LIAYKIIKKKGKKSVSIHPFGGPVGRTVAATLGASQATAQFDKVS
jgi:hypothetical protein